MYQYRIMECYSMSFNDLMIAHNELYSEDEFEDICYEVRKKVGENLETIVNCLVEEYGFKIVEPVYTYNYEI